MKKPVQFGKYFLLERVNVGGMAEVFKAKTLGVEGFERMLAVKRILPNIAEDKEFITMFIDEAKIAVQLNHANIAQIFDLGKVDDSYFIALEYVAGKDLRALFDRCRQRPEGGQVTMPIAQACFVVMKVCEGLDYAHNRRDAGKELHLVHRDVSPQNVLISYDGEVKLIDFGIAKAAGKAGKTQAGILKGKFGYMSPEQVRGLPLDRRSDVFAVGIVLYELLTGERLFVGESDFSTLEKVRNVEILPPSAYNRKIPEELERIVLKALSKDVDDRYQSAIDLHDDLQAFMYTAGEFYSRKELAAWMKRHFADEIASERERDESWRGVDLAAAAAAARAQAAAAAPADKNGAGVRHKTRPPPPPPPPSVPIPLVTPARTAGTAGSVEGADDDSLNWDDDELETHVYDTPHGAEDAIEAEEDASLSDLGELDLSPDGAPVPARRATLPPIEMPPPVAPSRRSIFDESPLLSQPAPGRAMPSAAPIAAAPQPAVPVAVTGDRRTLPASPRPLAGLQQAAGAMAAAAAAAAPAPQPAPARSTSPSRPAVPPIALDAHDLPPVPTAPSWQPLSAVPTAVGRASSPSLAPAVAVAPTPQPAAPLAVTGPTSREGRGRSSAALYAGLAGVLAMGGLAAAYLLSRPPAPGTLQLQVQPADGIFVTVDEQAVSASDIASLPRPPGAHVVSVERPGYKTWTERVELRSGVVDARRVVLEPLPRAGFAIQEPAGATVLLDGAALGPVTPFKAEGIVAGRHHIEVTLGDRRWSSDIQLAPDQILDVKPNLAAAPSAVGTVVALAAPAAPRVEPFAAKVEAPAGRAEAAPTAPSETPRAAAPAAPAVVKAEPPAPRVEPVAAVVRAPDPPPEPKAAAPAEPSPRDASRSAARPKAQKVASVATGTDAPRPLPSAPSEPEAAPEPPAPPPPRAAAPAAAEGFLRLNSKPWTNIAVDGKDTGLRTPQLHLRLNPGVHRVTLANPQFGVQETFTVEIHAGETETVIKDLRPKTEED